MVVVEFGVSWFLSAINDRPRSVMGRRGGFTPRTVCQLSDIFQLLFNFFFRFVFALSGDIKASATISCQQLWLLSA